MPKMLVTGSAGMTGSHVREAFPGYVLKLADKLTLDVREFVEVRKAFQEFHPDIVLHLAAETDIDKCERDHRHAFQTNAVGTQNVAIACRETDALLVYFSTTSVFPGEPNKIYTEFDTPQPVHVHGRSKLAGEEIVAIFAERFLIVRPGWMFGGFEKDKKFVGKLRKQIVQEGKKIVPGVDHIKGSPTYALDCLKLTRQLIENDLLGTFHLVNSGHCTRFEMAQLIAAHYNVVAEPKLQSELPPEHKPVAPRPASEMVQNWMLEFYGLAGYVRSWQLALKEYLEQWDRKSSPLPK
jgi:dTDP-4-dehydrorhamnose reductase